MVSIPIKTTELCAGWFKTDRHKSYQIAQSSSIYGRFPNEVKQLHTNHCAISASDISKTSVLRKSIKGVKEHSALMYCCVPLLVDVDSTKLTNRCQNIRHMYF